MPTTINAARQAREGGLIPVKSPIARPSSYDRIVGVEVCLMRPFTHAYLKAALNSPDFRKSCYPSVHRAEPLAVAQQIEPAEGLIHQSGHYIGYKSPFSEFNFVLNLANLLPAFIDHEAGVQAFFDRGVPRALDPMSLTLSDDGSFWGIDPSTVRQTGLPSYQITESMKRTGPSLDLLFNRLSALIGKVVKTGGYEFTPWSFEMHLPIIAPESGVQVNLYDIFGREDGGEVELTSEGFVDARIAVYEQIKDGLLKDGFPYEEFPAYVEMLPVSKQGRDGHWNVYPQNADCLYFPSHFYTGGNMIFISNLGIRNNFIHFNPDKR